MPSTYLNMSQLPPQMQGPVYVSTANYATDAHIEWEEGKWYSCLWAPAGKIPYPDGLKPTTPMKCVGTAHTMSGIMLGAMVDEDNSVYSYWDPRWSIFEVDDPTKNEGDMDVGGLFNSRTEDGLENSSDTWVSDETAEVLKQVAEFADVVNDEVKDLASAIGIIDNDLEDVHGEIAQLRRDLQIEYQKRCELEGKIESLTAEPPTPKQPPLLWDRITGEGPFIEVPMDYVGDRGMISVYGGDFKQEGDDNHARMQGRQLRWKSTLTTKRPVTKVRTPKSNSWTAVSLYCLLTGSVCSLAAFGGWQLFSGFFGG